jgi:hypothetical protein
MTTDRPRPAEDGSIGMPAALRKTVKGWRRRGAAGEQTGALTLPGRVLHVSVRGGDPRWPPLLLCNGIGARLELLQPFVDALDPRRC